MKVITVNASKGGPGKTMVSCHVASGLAARGKRVLLIDADPQGHATISFNLKKEPGIYDVLVRGADIVDRVKQPHHDTFRLPNEDVRGEFFVLPGNEETHAIATLVKDVELLREHLSFLDEFLDVVVIDTPPTPGMLMASIYTATDYLLVPTMLERLSMDGFLDTVTNMKNFKHHPLRLLGIVPNKYKNTALHKHYLTQLVKVAYENKWLTTPLIGDRTVFGDASARGYMAWCTAHPSKSDVKGVDEALKLLSWVERELRHAETI